MNCYLMALGTAGARLCEATLYGCMAGVIPADRVVMLLLCAPKDSKERIGQLIADYSNVRHAMEYGVAGAFHPALELRAWPEALSESSLKISVRNETDQLLCRALFTAEESMQDTSADLGGCGPVAALEWARLLASGHTALSAALNDLTETDELILCGSLCEATCAAGLPAVTDWLLKTHPRARVSTVLYLPVHDGDDAALCRAALRSINDRFYRAHCLVGLPEDCLDSRRNAAHLCDWMAVRCLDGVLSGAMGGHAIRVEADHLDWDDFGTAEDRYRRAYDGLMQSAWLMLTQYGQTAVDKLASPNWLLDRLGWYPTYFGAARRMSEDERADLARQLRTAMRLLAGYAAWMQQVLAQLPPPMQWMQSLDNALTEAREHYLPIIEQAGHLSMLEHEAEAGNMANERFVHRHDLADSAAEAMMKQIAALRTAIDEMEAAQEELNQRIGGRMQRSMLTDFLHDCREEAAVVRAQIDEVRQKIDHAAAIASPADQPRIEAARTRLGRMLRHLAAMDGRANWVLHDLTLANQDEIRTRAPLLDSADAGGMTPALYPLELLEQLGRLPELDVRDRKRAVSLLEQNWPAPQPLKAYTNAIAHMPAQPIGTLAGQLLRNVLQCTMTPQEGGMTNAKDLDERPGASA